MALQEIKQQRLLFWAERLLAVSNGTAGALEPREVEALAKLVGECRPALYPPVHLPPGLPKKLD